MNDLWTLDLESLQWTFHKGYSWHTNPDYSIQPPPVYGEKGVANATNLPGGRDSHAIVLDSSRNRIIMFGGYGDGADDTSKLPKHT